MNCPICGAEAKDTTPGGFDGLIVECKHCGGYAITDNALNDLIRLGFDARKSALDKAKRSATDGTRPTIDASYL
jgi:hypothetical protein